VCVGVYVCFVDSWGVSCRFVFIEVGKDVLFVVSYKRHYAGGGLQTMCSNRLEV